MDENSDTAMAAKAIDSGKNDPKNPSENGKPVKKPGNDKAGKGKGPDKSNHNDLFDPVPKAFKFYGGLGDNDLMSDMDTDGEENPNPKKRKNQPVPEPPSSEEDDPTKDPVLIINLISNANEANARSRELEQLRPRSKAPASGKKKNRT